MSLKPMPWAEIFTAIEKGEPVKIGTSNCPYGKCNGSGAVHYERDGYPFVGFCRCFRDRKRRELMTRGNFLPDYQGLSLWAETGRTAFRTKGDAELDKNRVLAVCREVARSIWKAPRTRKTPLSLILYGNSGTGKTHLASAITCDVLAKREMAVAFRDMAELNQELTDRGREGRSEGELIRPLIRVGLLVLDDMNLHQAPKPDTMARRVAYILKGRHEQRLPTIITTNMEWGPFREVQLPMIRSRIVERYRTAALTWGDYRAELAQQSRREP